MKNKEKIQILENRLNIQSKLLDKIITKLELDNEQEGLKQLDQSAFDHPYVDDRFKYVALNADSQAVFFESKPVISNCLDIWVVHTGSIMSMLKGYDTTNWQNSLIERESKPQLKKLDHSVFNGLDSKWKHAAVDGSTSRAYVFEHRPHLDHGEDYWGIYVGLQRFIGEDFDASNWKESLITRESKPQSKQLDQSIFIGLEDKWRFAAVDRGGEAWVYTGKPTLDCNYWHVEALESVGTEIAEGYDATNWQASLIKRDDIAKELLEVDLSSELTGSDLCRAMLARGDKYISGFGHHHSDRLALEAKFADTVSKHNHCFHSAQNSWDYFVPINNQGEPLTSSDVGL